MVSAAPQQQNYSAPQDYYIPDPQQYADTGVGAPPSPFQQDNTPAPVYADNSGNYIDTSGGYDLAGGYGGGDFYAAEGGSVPSDNATTCGFASRTLSPSNGGDTDD